MLCLLLTSQFLSAQAPPTPTFQGFSPQQGDKSHSQNQEYIPSQNITSHEQRSALQTTSAESKTNATSAHPYAHPNAIFNTLDRNNKTLTRQSNIPSVSASSLRTVTVILREVNYRQPSINYHLPSISSAPDHQHFVDAFNELSQMLNGKKPLDLKRATFISENAFFAGQMSYTDYSESIEEMATLIQIKMQQEGLSPQNNDALLYMAHKYFTDTLDIQMKFQEHTVRTFPKTYDFEDPFGYEDPTKMFVSKLVVENSGQCKSLPLLFLIVAEELGAEAYMSFSPSHSFVKCRDKKGVWYNIELTNGMLTSDSWVVGSGYVKSEAVKSGIFLDTLNKEQVIANCLVDLAQYYSWKYGGMDDFVLQCADKALEHHPNNIWAVQVKSDYYTLLFQYVSHQNNFASREELEKDPQAYELFQQRNRLYALTDGLGYQPMPQQAYMDWLKTLEEKQQEQEHQQQYIKFTKTIR